ncbi:T9SS type A sorting domain-containing protein [Pedobacter sp.]
MKRISTISILAIAISILVSSSANAQIAGWFFKDKDGSGNYTINTTGNEVTRAANLVGANLASAPVLSRGAGIILASNNTRTFNGAVNVTPANTTTGLTLSEAVSDNVYYEFTLFPAAWQVVSVGKIAFRFRKGSVASSDKVQFKYYVGALASNPANGDFIDLGATITSTSTATDGIPQEITGINAISDLQNVASDKKIIIRAYWYGNTASGAVVAFGKSVNNSGTVAEYSALSVFDTNTVLPVKLTFFTAKPSSNKVQLSWATASEHNNSHFEILRSANGEPNTVIGKVNGNGTTTAANQYRFTDYSPLANAYYQLRQVDHDGASQKSDIVVVSVNLNQKTLVAGAANGKIKASYQSESAAPAHFSVVDLNGRVIVNQSVFITKGANHLEIPVTLNSGLYLAKLTESDGKTQSAKFIYR